MSRRKRRERMSSRRGVFLVSKTVASILVNRVYSVNINFIINSRKSVTWSAVPDAPKLVYVGMRL